MTIIIAGCRRDSQEECHWLRLDALVYTGGSWVFLHIVCCPRTIGRMQPKNKDRLIMRLASLVGLGGSSGRKEQGPAYCASGEFCRFGGFGGG